MSRPSRNIDQALLRTGREMILETGAYDLKVRQVAARAKVNLGMFHYHFKSREEFIRCILQQAYEDFFKNFILETTGTGAPWNRLRRALLALGKFSRDNRLLLVTLLKDASQGHRASIRFAKKNLSRHLSILSDLIRQCQKSNHIRKMPLPLAISFLMGSIGMPSVIVAIVERAAKIEPLPISAEALRTVILSDAALELRVDMALQGIGPSIVRKRA